MKEVTLKLSKIQQNLKAGKNQKNEFGGYKYRSCEDILEAVKPLLGECTITITDDMKELAGRVYVEATASFTDGSNTITVTAFAREALSKKGMDEAQITGAASSYARKYALNGLLLIDDNKDADTQDNRNTPTPAEQKHEAKLATMRRAYDDNKESVDYIKAAILNSNYSSAAKAMAELDEDTRTALNVAPSKGGIWTLEEVKFFNTADYAKARATYFYERAYKKHEGK